MNTRGPTEDTCHTIDAHRQTGSARGIHIFAPGFSNAVFCYACVCVLFLAPIALLFSVQFADHTDERFYSHYHYIRTTIALLVIGGSVGGMMIFLGAETSNKLILSGLLLISFSATLAIARCLKGLAFALMRQPPSSYRSYIW